MLRRNWGKPSETTRKIERARAEGLEVICDFYPWVISATSNLAGRFGGALGSLNPALKGIAVERANLLAVLGDDRTWDVVKQALKDLFRREKAVNDARTAALLPTGAVVRNARDLRFWECIAYSPSHPEFFTLTFEDVASRLGHADYWDGMRQL